MAWRRLAGVCTQKCVSCECTFCPECTIHTDNHFCDECFEEEYGSDGEENYDSNDGEENYDPYGCEGG